MTDNLKKLAEKLGIKTSFLMMGREEKQVSDDLVKFFCGELGYAASTDEDAKEALKALEKSEISHVLAPIYVRRQKDLSFEINLLKENENVELELLISIDKKTDKQALAFSKTLKGELEVDGKAYVQYVINIQTPLEIGYYRFELHAAEKVYKSVLAVAPEKCYEVETSGEQKLWGFTVQLYSLKSRRNWGIGDFTDLKDLARIAAGVGANMIGINPINTPFHDFPENASPYASISRMFLNPIYIDVEKTAGFDEACRKKYQKQIEALKKTSLIDYTGVYNLKIGALYELYAKQKKSSRVFSAYKKKKGQALHLFALYEAIYHDKCRGMTGGWRAWPEGLKNQNPMDMAIFEAAHADEIEFFKFLQFEAERQFDEAAKYIQTLGMKIGLYRDLPVGVSKDSAELWAGQDVYLKNSSAGAPPDPFFTNGQDWGLGAFNAFELKKRAYEPFLKVLRANMKNAGALRMDHVMGLMRLFMISDEQNEGTYLCYDFEDMLGLVALESVLNKCVIVGESIGNVPEGFVDTLKANNINEMSVLWAERWDNGLGDFKAPEFYPPKAFVSVGTHDMPPLKMWWFGYEIELKYQLKMIDENEKRRLYQEREQDRWRLLKVLDENGVWPEDNLRRGNYLYGEGYPEGITEAVHRFLGKSASHTVILELENILGVAELQNLPGTDRDVYPNWRHRLPLDLEDLAVSEDFIRNVKAVKTER